MGVVAVLVLAIGMVLKNGVVVPVGIAVLGCQFILALYARGTTALAEAAVYGVALLLVSELAYWSLELGAHLRGDAEVMRGRLLAIGLLVMAALVVGLGAAAVAGMPLVGSVLLTALGVGSVLAVIALVAVLLWERRDA